MRSLVVVLCVAVAVTAQQAPSNDAWFADAPLRNIGPAMTAQIQPSITSPPTR